jgi:nicotinate-nucleotide--dimethylbenzimidazole phosphoribosyltransferase
MTDTGRIPGEGQPENAGGQPEVQQPGNPAADSYPYAGPADAAVGAPAPAPGAEGDLLLPGSHGAWNEAQPGVAAHEAYGQELYAQHEAYPQQDAYGNPLAYGRHAAAPQPGEQQQEQTPPVPGPHETEGRDSGSFDYAAVRASLDGHADPQSPGAGVGDAAVPPAEGGHGAEPGTAQAPAAEPAAPAPPRRPLHMGPPEPEPSGAVLPLSDRGPGNPAPGPGQKSAPVPGAVTAAPQRPPAAHAAQQAENAVPQGEFAAEQGPSTGGPEYYEFAHQDPETLPGPQLGALPPHDGQWDYQGQAAEAAVPGPAPQDAAYVADGNAPGSPAPPAPSVPEAETPGQPGDHLQPGTVPAAGLPADVQEPQELPQEQGFQHHPDQVPDQQPGQVPDQQVPYEQQAPAEQAPEAAPPADGAPPEPQGPEEAAAGEPKRRRAADEPEPESTGNTWVSTPGSTAVEAIEPQAAQGAETDQSQAGEAQAEVPAQAGSPEDGGLGTAAAEAGSAEGPETGDGRSEAAGQQAPVPSQAQQPGDGDGPQEEGAAAAESEKGPGDGSGAAEASPAETGVAEIPAQQQAEHADAVAAGSQGVEPGGAPGDEDGAAGAEAGGNEAAGMVPRQGQHGEPEAEPAAEDAEAAAAAPAAEEDAAPLADGASGVEETAGESGPGSEPGATEPVGPAEPAGPPAPGFADDEREAVHRLMRERRDIRNGFRSDPIPHEVLLRVLEAAHTAPSVGHSQPWDFVVIRSEETRRAMHELAERQREAYAKSLPKGRAKQFKELKIEAIRETPVNIVVTADPTRGGRHTLGRHTQPQMAPYSSALAVENLWLAARAEGLGVGWVSFFDEREMVRALELPEHLEVVAYLCVGYVDEFPPEPELAQAGWSKRRPLSWVVHEESYGRRVLPGSEPQDLLSDTVAAIRPLDAKALGEAWERQKRMTKPAGALGMLEIISAQLCGLSRKCPPPLPEPAAVAIFAGDHGVHAQGVTPWPQEVTGQMVANFLGGGAVCNAFANQVGAEVCVVDVGVVAELPATPGLLPRKVRAGTADMTQGPALTREEALRAVEVGIETARDLVAAGNKALLTGEMGIANTTVSAALVSVCAGVDPAEVTGRGTGINDETHARKVDVVRRALELHQPDPADPLGLLAAVGGLEHAALVGLILGAASLRTPVILDGVSAGAAALVARCIAPESLAACIAGHRSSEPGHVAALTKLGLRPLVDLDLRLGEGTGALLSLPLVQSAARAMHEVATFDSAGVTGKS